MAEQDLRINPKTGFRYSDPRNNDSQQNANYTRHLDPVTTMRDFSRPATIPAEEWEADGRGPHADAVEKYDAEQAAAAEQIAAVLAGK